MTAEPVGPDPAPSEPEPEVIRLRHGLCAVYVLREKPPPQRPVCRERPWEPLPWPPDENEPPPW